MEPVVGHFVRTFLHRSETFIYDQIRALDRYRVCVLARRRANQDITPWSETWTTSAYGSRLRRAVAPGYFHLGFLGFSERRRLAEIALSQRVSVLHAHYGPDGALVSPLATRLRVPLIVTFYGYDASSFPERAGGLGRRYLARAFSRASLILALSEDMRADLLTIGCPAEKICVHHFGIDLRRFPLKPAAHRNERANVQFLTVGRFVEKKGLLTLLDAFALAREGHPHLHLTLVGDGPLQAQVQRAVERLGLSGHVDLPGFLPHAEVSRAMRMADVFVLPSEVAASGDKEGTPTVLMEAMATGLPVIATHHAGIPEVVDHLQSGLLVPERDVVALASAIARLARSPRLWREWGLMGRSKIQREYDLDRQARRLEDIYDCVRQEHITR